MMTKLIDERLLRCKPHVIPFVFIVVLMLGLYFASIAIRPGVVTWAVSAVALLILAVTALARLNDITPEQTNNRWQARRAGLILVGASAFGLAAGDPMLVVVSDFVMIDFPSWKEVSLRWGVALMLLTTPQMPPWWRYITGEYKEERDGRRRGGDRRETGP